MNALTGTEEMTIVEESITEDGTEYGTECGTECGTENVTETTPIVLTGLAGAIAAEIRVLQKAMESAVELESGLTTKTAIKAAARVVRTEILNAKKNLSALYFPIMKVRNDMLNNMPQIKRRTEKERLLKQQENIAERLAELG